MSIRTIVTVPIVVSIVFGMVALARATRSSNTPALTVAVEDVSQRVEYVEHTLALAHARVPRGYIVALASMSYVVGHVSATQYGYLHQIAHQPLPSGAEQSLETGAGICGNATDSMLAILDRLHVKARRVNVYYSTPKAPVNGHSTVEVWYKGAWRWFDPTWGTIYVKPHTPESDVLSLVDVLKLPAAEQQAYRIGDDALLWPLALEAAGRKFGIESGMLFATLPHLRVEVGGATIYRR